MAKAKQVRITSKKHLARLEREHRQTRIIATVSIVILSLVIGLISYGILNATYLKSRQPIVTVNSDSIKLKEFQARVRVIRQQYVDQYMQYYQLAQMFGVDPSTDSSISSALSQIQSQLADPSLIGQQTIEEITNDLLIRQYASENGITVTEDEIQQAIQEAFQFFPEGTPTPTTIRTPITFSTLSAAQYALVSPTFTPTAFPSQTPDMAATATLIPTQAPAGTPTAVPSITPSPTAYTQDGFENLYSDALKHYASLGLSESLFKRLFFESNLYREKVTAIITADITRQQEQVWARHILVATEEDALAVHAQLLIGNDFATLAQAQSTDPGSKDKGGDLGWFGRGKMLAEFENAAFGLKIGEISQPVQTTYGWHIIQALGHEIRPLTDTEYNEAVTNKLNTWLSQQRTSATIVVNPIWTSNTPDLPNLETAFQNMIASATAYVKTQSVLEPTETP